MDPLARTFTGIVVAKSGLSQKLGRAPSEDNSPLVKAARETVEGKKVEWFFKAPVWSVVTMENGERIVEVTDLRFVSRVLPRPGAPFTCGFRVRGDPVEPLGWNR